MFSSDTTQVSDGGYQISRSLRFNSADSAYLNRTPASAGNRKTWTFSTWVKRSQLSSGNAMLATVSGSAFNYFSFGTSSGDWLTFAYFDGTSDIFGVNTSSTSVFRDVSAWYHIVLLVDTTQATAANRVKIYVNNVEQTLGGTYPTQNYDTPINNTISNLIGGATGSYTAYLADQYMTEINFIDGQALTPSSFGETNAQTGVWQPKAYSGSYGTNGFYLNFSDNSNTTAATLGKDYSGNGNNWTPNGFSISSGAGNDSLVDSPTSYGTDTGVGGTVRGNYSTYNPLVVSYVPPTYSNGNLDLSAAVGWNSAVGTIGINSGKWYWEVVCGNGDAFIGICGSNATLSVLNPQNSTGTISYFIQDGTKRIDGTSSSYGAAATTETIGVALDIDGGTVTFYKSNTSQGSISLSSSTLNGLTIFPFFVKYSSTMTVNFGQRPFAYTAPSGYKALCTQNLPTPTIGATTATQAGKYFNTVLYTGTDSAQTITGVGFQPDYVWLKNRTAANAPKNLDVLRGAGWSLSSAETGAEANQTNAFTAFTSDGFSVATNGGEFNASGRNYVAWNWKANGSGSTNTAGQITSTVSANTTSGFSIVTFTTDGTTKTVGHGLGVKPSLIIAKVRNGVGSWIVMTDIINGSMQYGTLNTTNAFASIGYSAPTSTVFQYNDNNGNTQVAYCFAEVAGYSKFGSYTGNGSTDGPFVYTGFRPAYVMVKPSSAAGSWWINDNKRDTYNVNDHRLNANTSDAEATAGFTQQDFLSNGFKWRNADSAWNGSGVTYIYMAFAENPFKYSLAR